MVEHTAYIFPGQGSQYVGMGRDLYDALDSCRSLFEQADEIVGFSLSSICFEGPEEELKRTNVCQPAILVHSAAVLKAMEEKGLSPECSVTGGLSLGEYTALFYAGVISFEQAIALVHKRGQLMQDASETVDSGMACVLKLDRGQVDEVLERIDGIVSVSNLNCPGQVVISGEKEALQKAVEALKQIENARIIPLKVAGAFHSAVMEPARDGLAQVVQEMDFQKPRIPVFSNATGETNEDPEKLKENIITQLVAPVLWER
ncbi:ACP S-malonyltransferase, partial [Planctomycetota bacterium]